MSDETKLPIKVEPKTYWYKIEENANGKYRISRKGWFFWRKPIVIMVVSGDYFREYATASTMEDAIKWCHKDAERIANERRSGLWKTIKEFGVVR